MTYNNTNSYPKFDVNILKRQKKSGKLNKQKEMTGVQLGQTCQKSNLIKVRDERSRSQWSNMETTLWKTYRPVINLVHILSMMRKYGSKVRVTMITYRNKHFGSIALNPGDRVYTAENFVFSPVSSLLSWRSHLFIWRLRKPINLA